MRVRNREMSSVKLRMRKSSVCKCTCGSVRTAACADVRLWMCVPACVYECVCLRACANACACVRVWMIEAVVCVCVIVWESCLYRYVCVGECVHVRQSTGKLPVGASLKRSTKSCASICAPRLDCRRCPAFPTTAHDPANASRWVVIRSITKCTQCLHVDIYTCMYSRRTLPVDTASYLHHETAGSTGNACLEWMNMYMYISRANASRRVVVRSITRYAMFAC